MTADRRRIALGRCLTSALVLASCGDDGSIRSDTSGPPQDTGVTFSDTVPVPDGSAPAVTTTSWSELVVTAGAPGGFPDDFPRPQDADVLSGSAVTVGQDRVLAVDLITTDFVATVITELRTAVDGAEFALLVDREDTLRFETDDYVGDILARETDAGTVVVLTATMPA